MYFFSGAEFIDMQLKTGFDSFDSNPWPMLLTANQSRKLVEWHTKYTRFQHQSLCTL